MHDIWNPWHGCVKYSEGCMNCYMYVLDKMRNQDGSHIYKTNDFTYPLSRNRDGTYKIQSGEKIKLAGKGYKDGKGSRGDLIAEVKIMVPKQITKEEEEMFKKLNEISKFNPRNQNI